ncbi:hypothetical protein ACIQJW_32250 [Streptomyces californicus]|uniref:hypothetical protein n=1 Tax=Streptomyces californicus TaxID=67351 RepID=UPI0038018E9D
MSQFEGLVAGAVGYGGGGFEAALCGEGSGAYQSGEPVMPPEGNRPAGIDHDEVGPTPDDQRPGSSAGARVGPGPDEGRILGGADCFECHQRGVAEAAGDMEQESSVAMYVAPFLGEGPYGVGEGIVLDDVRRDIEHGGLVDGRAEGCVEQRRVLRDVRRVHCGKQVADCLGGFVEGDGSPV